VCITKYTTRLKILRGINTLAYIIFTPPSVTKVKLCEIDITHVSILANFSLRITYLNGVEGGRHLRVVGTPHGVWVPFKGRRAGYRWLAGLAPYSQTVGYNITVIQEQAKRSS